MNKETTTMHTTPHPAVGRIGPCRAIHMSKIIDPPTEKSQQQQGNRQKGGKEKSTRAADRDSYVRVSPRDHRYFELTNGTPYIPIGYNLIGGEESLDREALLDTMAKHRVNFIRIWLGRGPWNAEHTRSGEYDIEKGKLLKEFLDMAGARGIRVKLCIENFWDIPSKHENFGDAPLHHRDNGGAYTGMNEFVTSEAGRAQYKRKLDWWKAQIGDHPAVFAWELWNEMNNARTSTSRPHFEWIAWTQEMLPEAKKRFPANLITQSLSGFGNDWARSGYQQLSTMPANDIAQVHRYANSQHAKLPVCHGPMDVAAADAVSELLAFGAGKPVLLAEIGLNMGEEEGASKFYPSDTEGVILHDQLFAPFFRGAAGPGHPWWWRQVINTPNQWHHFARFAAAIDGIDPGVEHFEPVTLTHPQFRVYALKGARTLLLWCRDARNDWKTEFEQNLKPDTIRHATLDLTTLLANPTAKTARCYDPWTDRWSDAPLTGVTISLPDVYRSLVVRITVAAEK